MTEAVVFCERCGKGINLLAGETVYTCNVCKKKVCKECSERCIICDKYVCKDHLLGYFLILKTKTKTIMYADPDMMAYHKKNGLLCPDDMEILRKKYPNEFRNKKPLPVDEATFVLISADVYYEFIGHKRGEGSLVYLGMVCTICGQNATIKPKIENYPRKYPPIFDFERKKQDA